MIIDYGTPEDAPFVLTLLKLACEEAGRPFRPDYLSVLYDSHVASAAALVLLLRAQSPVGVLMARCGDHPMGFGRVAVETVWYVRPEARGPRSLAMLPAYEQWAREQGCIEAQMVSLSTNDVSPIFRRAGYAPVETHFSKVL